MDAAPHFEYAGVQSAPGGVWDVLADGRVIGLAGHDIMIETDINSGEYNVAGWLPDGLIAPWGASFAELSPNGRWLLVGDNNFDGAFVYLVDLTELDGGELSPEPFLHENFEAQWFDNQRVAISYGNPQTFVGEVAILDVSTGESTPVISIDGASAGVAFDPGGFLLAGNGYDFAPGGSATGDVRAFTLASILDVMNGQSGVIDFADSGTFVMNALSASSLRVDLQGHLFVGGGRADESDYFAIAGSSAVARALAFADPVESDDLFVDDPAHEADSRYRARFNDLTDEWVVDAGDGELHRFVEIPCFELTVDRIVGGETSTFEVNRGTPGGRFVLVFGFAAGRSLLDDVDGYCASFGIYGVDRGRLIGRGEYVFDSRGTATVEQYVPRRKADRTIYFQAAQRGRCPGECMSNVLRRAVE